MQCIIFSTTIRELLQNCVLHISPVVSRGFAPDPVTIRELLQNCVLHISPVVSRGFAPDPVTIQGLLQNCVLRLREEWGAQQVHNQGLRR